MKLPKLSYVSSEEWIINKCKDKTVLHLGCAGDDTLKLGKEACLQYQLSKVAKQILGIEINKDSLEKILSFCPESDSIRYIVGNVEHLGKLNIEEQKFDIILAGSIIEHLSNPGLMLSSIRPFCHSGEKRETHLLIVTPHVWGLLQFLRVAFTRNESVNPEHTCWFSIPTLTELCSRYGFKSYEFKTGYGYRQKSINWAVKKFFGTLFFRFFPHLGGSLIATFKYKELTS
jgi:ubiquinone/menaquinone biosynthesis C-methylase UbiE